MLGLWTASGAAHQRLFASAPSLSMGLNLWCWICTWAAAKCMYIWVTDSVLCPRISLKVMISPPFIR